MSIAPDIYGYQASYDCGRAQQALRQIDDTLNLLQQGKIRKQAAIDDCRLSIRLALEPGTIHTQPLPTDHVVNH